VGHSQQDNHQNLGGHAGIDRVTIITVRSLRDGIGCCDVTHTAGHLSNMPEAIESSRPMAGIWNAAMRWLQADELMSDKRSRIPVIEWQMEEVRMSAERSVKNSCFALQIGVVQDERGPRQTFRTGFPLPLAKDVFGKREGCNQLD
jgi:hypothetical protein